VEGVVLVSVGVVLGVVLGADLLQILVGLRHLVDLLFLEVALEDDLLQNLLRVDLLFLGVVVEEHLLQILKHQHRREVNEHKIDDPTLLLV